MKVLLFALLWFMPQAAYADDSGLVLQSGWQEKIITECGNDLPDILLLSANKKYLYQSCEAKSNMQSPSLARIHIDSGKRDILLYGLARAGGMRFAVDGSIWLDEEQPNGMIWRIQNPDHLQAGQQVDRDQLQSTHHNQRQSKHAK